MRVVLMIDRSLYCSNSMSLTPHTSHKSNQIPALEGLGHDDPPAPAKSGKRRPAASHHAHKAAAGPGSITARLPRGVTAI